MNYEDCLSHTINSSVQEILEQMKKVSSDDRTALFLEHLETLTSTDKENIHDALMVPNFPAES